MVDEVVDIYGVSSVVLFPLVFVVVVDDVVDVDVVVVDVSVDVDVIIVDVFADVDVVVIPVVVVDAIGIILLLLLLNVIIVVGTIMITKVATTAKTSKAIFFERHFELFRFLKNNLIDV